MLYVFLPPGNRDVGALIAIEHQRSDVALMDEVIGQTGSDARPVVVDNGELEVTHVGFESADGVHGLPPSYGWPNRGVACAVDARFGARDRAIYPVLAAEFGRRRLQNSTATIGYRPPVRFPILLAVLR